MAKIRTHYDNLRVARNAPDIVIKAAYKALCQTYHPDKFQGSKVEAERIMKLINTSYTVLIDPVKRAEHDAWIDAQEAAANQQHEKATFGETGEATEQTYQKQETKREYTPPPTEPEPPKTKAKVVKTASSMGWEFWVQMIVGIVIAKLFGILGGFVAWGILYLIAFVIKKYNIAWWVFATVIVISLFALQLYLTSNVENNIASNQQSKQQVQAVQNTTSSTSAPTPQAETNCIGNCTNGQGTYTFANGGKYVGEFKDGKTNGQGTFIFANGDKYVGENKDDNMSGQGTYTFVNGDKYVGEFKDGKKNGQGTFTSANGGKYVGEFKDDEPNGQGTYTFANGNKYVGEIKDAKPNGQGVFTASNGTVERGLWKNGKLIKDRN
jgi:hypothetical protein